MNNIAPSKALSLPPGPNHGILILDDDVEVGKALGRDLRSVGEVDVFNDPRQAIGAIASKDYAVIISDLQMPTMDGLTFLSHCAEIKPEAQRILLTAYADLANPSTSVNKARLNMLLTKPWEPDDLRSAVELCRRSYNLVRENSELRRIALSDALTGIANHRYFWERLDAEFSRAKRYGRKLSLIMADIDDFKKVNDQKGHLEGDRVLRDVALVIDAWRRAMDTVARYGGEEFAIVLPEASSEQAMEIARRHLEKVVGHASVSLSMGVASFPDDAQSPTELLHLADLALLKAKREGKGRVVAANTLTEAERKP